MTHTLVNKTHEPIAASRKLSYLMIAFAITSDLLSIQDPLLGPDAVNLNLMECVKLAKEIYIK